MQVRLAPEPIFFRFMRPVTVDSGAGENACAVLDRMLYAHAQPALADVRLMARGISGLREVPYALTVSKTEGSKDAAWVLNLEMRKGQLGFDLEMPPRPYSEVHLDLSAINFLATAKVMGLKTPTDGSGVYLGTFTLFDLSALKLGRSTVLPLAESAFPYLHVELQLEAAPGHASQTNGPNVPMDASSILGAEVPASREAQTVYVPLWQTSEIVERGRSSVAVFAIAAHVPVERVSFELKPNDQTNFSRTVHLRARAESRSEAAEETYTGQIARIRMNLRGMQIRETNLSVRAVLGSNAQSGAQMEVSVENGDDAPLNLSAVRLEMRERKLCFKVPREPLALYYGDAKLGAPLYDYSSLFNTAEPVRTAILGDETKNPAFKPRLEVLTERRPELVWIALLAVLSVLGVLAFRSAKRA